MTKTVSVDSKWVAGNKRYSRATVDITSYTSGGEPITAAELGLKSFEHLEAHTTENGFLGQWNDSTTSAKILAYEAGADGAALDEAADTTDIGTVEVVAFGK